MTNKPEDAIFYLLYTLEPKFVLPFGLKFFIKVGLLNSTRMRKYILKNIVHNLLETKKTTFLSLNFFEQKKLLEILRKIFPNKEKQSIFPQYIYEYYTSSMKYQQLLAEIDTVQTGIFTYLLKDKNIIKTQLENIKAVHELIDLEEKKKQIVTELAAAKKSLDTLQKKAGIFKEKIARPIAIPWLNSLTDEFKEKFLKPVQTVHQALHAIEVPKTFETKWQWQLWQGTIQKICDSAEIILGRVETAERCTAKMKEVTELLKKCPFQAENFSLKFQKDLIQIFEAKELHLDTLFPFLHTVTTCLQTLIHDYEKNNIAFRKEVNTTINVIFSKGFSCFRDLVFASEKTIQEKWSYEKLEFSEWNPEIYTTDFTAYFQKKILDLQQIAEDGKKRIEKIVFIEKECSNFICCLEFLKSFNDTQALYIESEATIKKMILTQDEIQRIPQDALTDVIDARYRMCEKFIKEKEEYHIRLVAEYKQVVNTFLSKIQALECREIELITDIHPYPDIRASLVIKRAEVTGRLYKIIEQFFQGYTSNTTVEKELNQIPYEEDVKKLRSEFSARALRLKDIRGSCIAICNKASAYICWLHIFLRDSSSKDVLYAIVQKAQALVHDIESPFQLFENAQALEDVNATFRSLWVRQEALVKELSVVEKDIVAILEKLFDVKVLHKLLESVEHIILKKTARRIDLLQLFVQSFEERTERTKLEKAHAVLQNIIEQYPFLQLYPYFCSLNQSKMVLNVLEDAFDLYNTIKHIILFAKKMQWLKTFEEERIDEFLELFEHATFIVPLQSIDEAAWQPMRQYLIKRIYEVVENIFLDIGLLDNRAIMDTDQEKLCSILESGLQYAQRYLMEAEEKTFEFSFVADLNRCMKESISVWQKQFEVLKKNKDSMLMFIESAARIAYKRKIVHAAQSGNNFALLFALREEVIHIYDLFFEQYETKINCDVRSRLIVLEQEMLKRICKNYVRLQETQFILLIQQEFEIIKKNISRLLGVDHLFINTLDQKIQEVEIVKKRIDQEKRFNSFFHCSGNITK